jgi:photosystem II stability/assembly factor-like uncharacterized protein
MSPAQAIVKRRIVAAIWILFLTSIPASTGRSQSAPDFYARDVASFPQDRSFIVAGSESGFYRSIDNATTWQKLWGFNFKMVSIHQFNSDILFGTYRSSLLEDGLLRSTDGGGSWTVIAWGTHLLKMGPAPPSGLFAQVGPSWLLKSHNGGSTWDTIRTPVEASSLALMELDSSIFYLGSSKGVYRSNNGGSSWDSLGLSSINKSLLVAVDPRSADIVYAATQFGDSLFKSTDGGRSWELKGSTFESIRHLLINTEHPEEIYIGTDSGTVMRSSDAGTTWAQFGPRLGYRIDAMWYDGAGGGRLLLGGRDFLGIQILNVPTYVDNDLSDPVNLRFEIFPNYPNPFNPVTSIDYSLPERADIRLTVTDIIGREIATLCSGPKTAGVHNAKWDGSPYPSGVYMILFRARGESGQTFGRTLKITLAK